MSESENEPGQADQEEKENLPPFEGIRKIALAELGPVNTLGFQEALAKTQEIADKEAILNPLLVVYVQGVNRQEFALRPDEGQWSDLVHAYEDGEELAAPVAFVVDGDKYHF